MWETDAKREFGANWQLEKPDILIVAVEAAKEMRYLLGLEENIIPIETVDEPDDINDEDTKKTMETKK